MKILQVHNEYQTPGGEEAVLEAERTILEQDGHQVKQWIARSADIKTASSAEKLRFSLNSVWSKQSYRQAKAILRNFSPDVVHVHNTVPLITPSVYAACQSEKIPVVQTLHNFKFVCPGSNLYRDGQVCEQCIGKSFTYPALLNGCYRRDYLSTAFLVSGLTFNRIRKTYSREINAYIALTEFSREKFIEAGIDAEKIFVKPNFVTSDITPGNHDGNYALFVGRLITQKGIETMIKAWSLLGGKIPLKIAGSGYLSNYVTANLPENVSYLGQMPRQDIINLMRNATLLIFPSEWYEGFPMTIVEAFATELPVVASRLGGMAEIVKPGYSGWHFNSGDAYNLASVVQRAWQDSTELKRRGELARKQFELMYSPQSNLEKLLDIYQETIHKARILETSESVA